MSAAVVLTVVLLVVVTAAISSVGPARLSPTLAAPRMTPVRVPITPGEAAALHGPPPPQAPTLVRSLVLRNDTVVPGLPSETNCPVTGGLTEGDGQLFVSCGNYEQILEINASTYALDGVISIPTANGSEVGGIAFDPGTNCIYIGTQALVGLHIYSNLTGYNLSTGSWGPTWPAGGVVGALEYDPTDQLLYEAATYSDTINGYDPATGSPVVSVSLQSSVAVGATVIDPTSNWMYVGLSAQDEVDVLNLSSQVFGAVVPVPGNVGALAYDPVENEVFVTISNASNVTVLNASSHTVVGVVPTGAQPDGVAWDPVGDEVFIANAGSANMTIVNPFNFTVEGLEAVGPAPGAVLFDPNGSSMVVLVDGNASLVALDDLTALPKAHTTLGAYPLAVAYDPRIDAVLVADGQTDSLVAYSEGPWTSPARVQLATTPMYLLVDAATDRIFVADQLPNQISVLNASTLRVESTFPLVGQPTELAYDASSGLLVVAEADGTNLTFLNASNGALVATTPFDYAEGLALNPGLGTVFASGIGGPLSGNRPYVAAVSLTSFDVTGAADLPSDPNLFSIGFDPADGSLYVGTGAVTDVLSPGSLDLEFTLNGSGGGDLLADGTTGAVGVMDYNGLELYSPGSSVIVAVPLWSYGQGAVDPAHSLFFAPDLSNGTVAIVALGPDGTFVAASPSAFVLGNSTLVSTSELFATPPLSFAYLSLPPGCGSADVRVLNCTPNRVGNYTIMVVLTDGSGLSGTASTELAVEPSLVSKSYTVTFNETGLGPGANWTVSFDGTLRTSANTSIPFLAVNGTYPFLLSAAGYVAVPVAGNITVAGADITRTVAFTAVGPGPHGFLAGTVDPASVRLTINGTVTATSGGRYNVSLTPGHYALAASAAGYVAFTTTATVTAGRTTTLNVSLAPNTTTGTSVPSAAPTVYIWVGVGAGVAVVALAAVWLVGRRRGGSSAPGAPSSAGESPEPPADAETIYR
ncbi:MAG: YncE family protein [Thermoplasmata archaeon]|nr:YncE family protein [Thermoplasmata archaeon]